MNIPTISTGNILRDAIKSGSKLGQEAKSFIDAGNLVPDAVVIGIVRERLAAEDCKGGFVLDGFPRTVPQAVALDEMGVQIDRVIDLEVPDEDILQRLGGRRVCPKCGATYHLKYNPSSKGEQCEKCGEALIIRKDDEPQTIKDRLRVYHDQTEPLKAYYQKAGRLIVVEGQEEVADTTRLTLAALGE